MRCPQRRGIGMLPQSQLFACWPPVSLQSGPEPDGSEKRDRAADRSTWRQEIVGSTGSSADLTELLVRWSARKPSEHVTPLLNPSRRLSGRSGDLRVKARSAEYLIRQAGPRGTRNQD